MYTEREREGKERCLCRYVDIDLKLERQCRFCCEVAAAVKHTCEWKLIVKNEKMKK